MSKDDRELIEARTLFEIARPCFHYAKRGTGDGGAFEASETGRQLMKAMKAVAADLATRLEALQAQPVGEDALTRAAKALYKAYEETTDEHVEQVWNYASHPDADVRAIWSETVVEMMQWAQKTLDAAALTASPPVVDDLSPATRRMEQILDAPFVRKGETPQAFERLQAMMPADRARDGMTTIAVRGEDMRALLDAILDRPIASPPPVVAREAIARVARALSDASDNGLASQRFERGDNLGGYQALARAAILALTPVEGVGEPVTAIEIAAEEYVNEYVMSTDGNDYVPTEWERELISDALAGWLSEQPALSIPVAQGDEVRDALEDEQATDALRYILNFADCNTRVSTVMNAFTLPGRVSVKDRLEHLFATLTKGARDAG